jgi:hypothetical protein
MSSLNWGDVPTWGLLLGAVVTAWYAVRAFKAQRTELAELQAEGVEQRKVNEKQIAVLELQRLELEASLRQRAADAKAARSAQASQVHVWFESKQAGDRIVSQGRDYYVSGEQKQTISAGPSLAVYVHNTSKQPIYDLVVRTDHGADDYAPRLLSDAFVVFYRPPEATWAVADFRDANLALWSRGVSGHLVDRGEMRPEATGEVIVMPNRTPV